MVVRRLPSSGDGPQQEVERVVAVGQQVFGTGEPSPAVDAPQSGLDALDIDVRAAVGHEVARVADIFRRAVVELRVANGMADAEKWRSEQISTPRPESSVSRHQRSPLRVPDSCGLTYFIWNWSATRWA